MPWIYKYKYIGYILYWIWIHEEEITLDVSSSQIGDRRKWEELNINCLVNVFQKVGMETLLLDVPLVCKSWYKATLHPMCWQHLIFPENFEAFADRIMKEYQKEIPITSFIKFIVNRSSRCATTLMLPYAAVKKGWSMLLSSKLPKIFYQRKIIRPIWEHFQQQFSKNSFGELFQETVL